MRQRHVRGHHARRRHVPTRHDRRQLVQRNSVHRDRKFLRVALRRRLISVLPVAVALRRDAYERFEPVGAPLTLEEPGVILPRQHGHHVAAP